MNFSIAKLLRRMLPQAVMSAIVFGLLGAASGANALVPPPPTVAQTITFNAAPTVVVGGTGTVSATGGASGNPVVFSSLTPGVCTVSGTNGSIVTKNAAGVCTIAANQAGSTTIAMIYLAAPQVTQNMVDRHSI